MLGLAAAEPLPTFIPSRLTTHEALMTISKEKLKKLWNENDYKGQGLTDEEKEEVLQEFENQLRKAFFNILLKVKFWGGLIYKFRYFADFNVPTACCFRNRTIHINPILFLSCTTAQQCFIIVHEVGHFAFRHFHRSEVYLNKVISASDKNGVRGRINLIHIYYYACDFAINWIIKETFHNSGLVDCYPTIRNIPFPLDNKKYYGLSAEEIFEDLVKHIKNSDFEFVSDSPDFNNQNLVDENSEGLTTNNQSIKIDGNVYKTFDEHRNFNSGNTQEDLAEEVEFKSAIQNTFQSMQSRGSLSKNLQILYNKLFTGSINWVDVLSSYIHRSLAIISGKVDYTWDRPNRRLIHAGIYLPSMIGKQLNICVGLDVSGSMLEVLDRVIPEVLGLVNQYNTNCYLISCDCEIKNVQQVSSEYQLDLRSFLVGGGGTRITPIFEYIEEELKGKCDLVIIATDGYIDDVDNKFSEYETIWLIINNPKFKPNFGNTIYLDKNGEYVFV